jgi:hypothetical protein
MMDDILKNFEREFMLDSMADWVRQGQRKPLSKTKVLFKRNPVHDGFFSFYLLHERRQPDVLFIPDTRDEQYYVATKGDVQYLCSQDGVGKYKSKLPQLELATKKDFQLALEVWNDLLR